jgi:release factor glutamine methyltransferase
MRKAVELPVASCQLPVRDEGTPGFSRVRLEARSPSFPHASIASALAETEAELATLGVGNPRLEAEVLLAYALGIDRSRLFARLRDALTREELTVVHGLLQRRARHEPLQYITGIQEFWSLAFKVDARVLIPRPETEVVVETALRLLSHSALRTPHSTILDVGTGSGCIAIALARELSQVEVWATDISAEALAVASENARRQGVAERIHFLQGDLFLPVADRRTGFDLIVSNPPYVACSDFATLQPEVCDWEPRVALDGGPDGLDFYRRLLTEGPAYLRAGGWLVMEIGHGQGAAIIRLAQEQGDLTAPTCITDYAGKERVTVASKVKTSTLEENPGEK